MLGVARSIYLRLPASARLWELEDRFVRRPQEGSGGRSGRREGPVAPVLRLGA